MRSQRLLGNHTAAAGESRRQSGFASPASCPQSKCPAAQTPPPPGASAGRCPGATHLPELGQVEAQRLQVLVKAQRGHAPQQVVAVDGLALLARALVRRPTRMGAACSTLGLCPHKQTCACTRHDAHVHRVRRGAIGSSSSAARSIGSTAPPLLNGHSSKYPCMHASLPAWRPYRAHSLAGDEADKLRHAFLHRLLCVLCDLCVARQLLLHDAADVGNGQVAVLLTRLRACGSWAGGDMHWTSVGMHVPRQQGAWHACTGGASALVNWMRGAMCGCASVAADTPR